MGGIEEDLDEKVADDFALPLRVLDAGEGREEFFRGVDREDIDPQLREAGLHVHRLVLPQEAGVDEDRPELDAGVVEQDGEDGRVDPAGDAADDLVLAELLLDVRADLVAQRVDGEGLGVRAEGEEIAQDAPLVLGVGDLGVELDAEVTVRPLQGDRGALAVGGGDGGAFGYLRDGVRVAPSGIFETVSEWLIQMRVPDGTPWKSGQVASVGTSSAGPNSRRSLLATRPPHLMLESCMP